MDSGASSSEDGPCVCTGVRKTARVVSLVYDQALAPVGLRVTQYALLTRLSRDEPAGFGRLCDDLLLDRTALGRNLEPLVRDGLVRVEPGEDRRTRLVWLTEAGEATLAEARPLWRDVQARVVESFGVDRYRALLGELAALVDASRGARGEGGPVLPEAAADRRGVGQPSGSGETDQQGSR